MQSTAVELHTNNKTIGSLLLEAGKIRAEDADRIIKAQKQYDLKFGDAAVLLGLITQEDIRHIVSQQFDFHCLSREDNTVDKSVIAAFQSFGYDVDTLRGLRSQLSLRWFTGHKLLVIAPVIGKTGASYIAANLAVLFSQLGQKTLLIDADMRQPSQSKLFKLKNKAGLSDLLADRAGLEVIETHSKLTNLSLMSSGTIPPNPIELLGQSKIKNILSELQAHYDVILLDTPAILEHCDAQTLSAICHGTMLVAKRHSTRVSAIEKAKQKVLVAGAYPVGVVLNEFK
jgi:chain length determinant protein tyrosine kinase EpsG